jgi:uncharacterized tellurite resistance protein B-like protein
MFEAFLNKLAGRRTDAPRETEDSRLAMAALLVRVARTDGVYAPAEIARIDTLLEARFDLGTAGAAELRSRAEALECVALDNVQFTRAIKDAVALDDRTTVIEALWEVVLSDGARDDDENGFLRLVANLLGINDRDSALARQRVLARLS